MRILPALTGLRNPSRSLKVIPSDRLAIWIDHRWLQLLRQEPGGHCPLVLRQNADAMLLDAMAKTGVRFPLGAPIKSMSCE
jgi:hypothetical protein